MSLRRTETRLPFIVELQRLLSHFLSGLHTKCLKGGPNDIISTESKPRYFLSGH